MMLAAAIESDSPSPLTMASYGNREIPDRQAVDQAVIGRRIQRLDRPAHREMGGAQDVEAVDFLAIGRGDRPNDVRISGEFVRRAPRVWSALIFLESSSPGRRKTAGRMTAAAATGPANGPRPASSTPAIR